MGKGPLNSVATKDKGKTAITAIKYSTLDRAMFFSFYNHLQPLWVWADRTSISSRKLNLHVNVERRLKASIKGEGSNLKKGAGKNGQKPEPSSPPPGEDSRGEENLTLYEHHEKPTIW